MKNSLIGRVVAALVVLALIVGGWWVFAGKNGGGSKAAGTYVTKTLDTGTIRRVVSASGSVRPLITVEIGSQLSGQIAELKADYNDEVKKGQLLARIDPQSFQTKVTQARAELAVAKAGVDIQKASIARAKANLKEAERTYKRQKDLRAQGNVSESALDAAETQVETGKADVLSAEAQLRNAEATVTQRQAALEQAEIDLERTEIRSSINGTVIARQVDLGQTVAASLQAPTLFEIAQDLSEIQVEADVDEADIGSVKPGDRVEFTVDAYDGRTFTGKVEQVRLAPTEQSNVVTYTVVISARNPGRILLPGMTANVDIVTGEKSNVIRVPNDAFRFRPKTATAPAATSNSYAARLQALVASLGMSKQQEAAFMEKLKALRSSMPTANGDMDTRDRVLIREKFKAGMEQALKDVLTPEQWQRHEAAAAGRAEVRHASVWTLGADGQLKEANVGLGLSDEDYSEVVYGLKAGDKVVVREERAAK